MRSVKALLAEPGGVTPMPLSRIMKLLARRGGRAGEQAVVRESSGRQESPTAKAPDIGSATRSGEVL